jgi:hypothetical protein
VAQSSVGLSALDGAKRLECLPAALGLAQAGARFSAAFFA